eukprot:g68226.t1
MSVARPGGSVFEDLFDEEDKSVHSFLANRDTRLLSQQFLPPAGTVGSRSSRLLRLPLFYEPRHQAVKRQPVQPVQLQGLDSQPLLSAPAASSMEDLAHFGSQENLNSDSYLLPPNLATLDMDKATIAAAYISDAMYARGTYHIYRPPQLWVYRVLYSRRFGLLLFLLLCLQLSLALFEPPCNPKLCWAFPATHALEAVILAFHMLHAQCQLYAMGGHAFLRNPWRVAYLSITIIALLNVLLSLCLIAAGVVSYNSTPTSMFLARVLRPFFLLASFKRLRRISHRCYVTIIAVLPILILNLIVISVFACLGYVFFSSIPGYASFATVSDAWISLYTLTTTANFPDVMLPAYNAKPWSALYFVMFLTISFFIFNNLILGTVYNNYKTQCAKSLHRGILKSSEALRMAFSVLDEDQDGLLRWQMDLELFTLAIQQLNSRLSPLMCRSFFFALDNNEDGNLSLEDFGYLLNYVSKTYLVRMEPPIQWTGWRDLLAGASCAARVAMLRDGLRQLLFTWRWQPPLCGQYVSLGVSNMVDLMVVVTCSLWVIEIVQGGPIEGWRALHDLAMCVFWAEMLALMLAEGVRTYLSSFLNLLDLALNIYSLADICLEVYGNEQTFAAEYVPYIRVLRLLRLFVFVKKFRVVMRTVGTSLVVLFAYFGVLMAIFYFFAIVSIETFCYQLTPDTVPSDQPYYQLQYWHLNFDTFASAWVVLFHQLAVSNFFVIMEAVASVLASVLGGSSRLFFWFFRTLGVSLMSNITIAVLVEVVIFQQEMAEQNEEHSQAQLKSVEETKLQEVATLICHGRAVSVQAEQDWETQLLRVFDPKNANKGVRFGI